MIHVESCAPTFAQLEALNQRLAFEIVERVYVLVTFTESGAPLESRHRSLHGCQQLIVGRRRRVAYEYDAEVGGGLDPHRAALPPAIAFSQGVEAVLARGKRT